MKHFYSHLGFPLNDIVLIQSSPLGGGGGIPLPNWSVVGKTRVPAVLSDWNS